jgi:hypothetical protein
LGLLEDSNRLLASWGTHNNIWVTNINFWHLKTVYVI